MRSSPSSATRAARAALRADLRAHARDAACASSSPTRSASSDAGGFDRILLDPPCTGLGTLRSNPDLRWRVREGDVATLAAAQDAMLERARGMLRPGGRLVYSVCTLSPREERLQSDDAGARCRPRTVRTASIVPPMGDEPGLRCPSCREPWLRPTALPGRYRCGGCLHRFELRSVCPGCGEHSDDRAHGEHVDDGVRALPDLHAPRGLGREPRGLVADRLTPPAFAGRCMRTAPLGVRRHSSTISRSAKRLTAGASCVRRLAWVRVSAERCVAASVEQRH